MCSHLSRVSEELVKGINLSMSDYLTLMLLIFSPLNSYLGLMRRILKETALVSVYFLSGTNCVLYSTKYKLLID